MMRSGPIVVRCWMLVMLVACGPAILQLPSQGGAPWLELTSPHFTLWTDTSDDRAHELIREMEHLRQVLIGTAFRSVAREGRIFVLAVRDLDEFHAYFPDRFVAFAFSAEGHAMHQPLIVLTAFTPTGDEELVEAHEQTHAISYGLIPHQPRWFSEGLAMYFETVRIDGNLGAADVGRPPERNGQPLRMHHLIGLRTMFACKKLECLDTAFYATVWAVFTYLQNAHTDELARFEQLLAANPDWEAAWREAFPHLPVDVLEEEMKVWLLSGSHRVLHFDVRLADYPATRRALGDGDVHAIRALLAPHAEELVELEAARRTDPTNVLASVLTHYHDHPLTPEAARAVAAAHPEDWQAWWLLAIALRQGDEAMAAAGKACALAAANPAVVPPDGLCVPSKPGEQAGSQ